MTPDGEDIGTLMFTVNDAGDPLAEIVLSSGRKAVLPVQKVMARRNRFVLQVHEEELRSLCAQPDSEPDEQSRAR